MAGIVRVIDLPALGSRDTVAAKVRRIARSIRADVALLVHEAWSLSPQDTPHHARILAQYGSFDAYPGRVEVLAVQLETPDGVWIGSAPIELSGDAKRCGPMTVQKGDAAIGRLSHWLAPP